MTWGPFVAGIAPDERMARIRSLRLALKLLTGERGRTAGYALLRCEISGDDADLLAEASVEFDRLTPIDRRRVMAAISGTLLPGRNVKLDALSATCTARPRARS